MVGGLSQLSDTVHKIEALGKIAELISDFEDAVIDGPSIQLFH
jgi:hypothetical protein